MSLSCNTVQDLLVMYQERSLSPETEREVQEHLDGCPACRAEYKEVARSLRQKQRAPEVAECEMEDKIEQYARVAKKLRRRRILETILTAAGAAAAVTAAVLITVAVFRSKRNKNG